MIEASVMTRPKNSVCAAATARIARSTPGVVRTAAIVTIRSPSSADAISNLPAAACSMRWVTETVTRSTWPNGYASGRSSHSDPKPTATTDARRAGGRQTMPSAPRAASTMVPPGCLSSTRSAKHPGNHRGICQTAGLHRSRPHDVPTRDEPHRLRLFTRGSRPRGDGQPAADGPSAGVIRSGVEIAAELVDALPQRGESSLSARPVSGWWWRFLRLVVGHLHSKPALVWLDADGDPAGVGRVTADVRQPFGDDP